MLGHSIKCKLSIYLDLFVLNLFTTKTILCIKMHWRIEICSDDKNHFLKKKNQSTTKKIFKCSFLFLVFTYKPP